MYNLLSKLSKQYKYILSNKKHIFSIASRDRQIPKYTFEVTKHTYNLYVRHVARQELFFKTNLSTNTF